MDILRRRLAPISDLAWKEIDVEARRTLVARLSARRFVDVDGPHGWDASTINLGQVTDIPDHGHEGVELHLRRVQPLVEVRVPFTLSLRLLDDFERGADIVDLEPVHKAAVRAARLEEHALYRGLAPAGIRGILASSDHEALDLGRDPATMTDRAAAAMLRLQDSGVEGPYLLVLGPRAFRALAAENHGYPPRQQLAKLLGTAPVVSPSLEGGIVASTRGEDFRLTLGLDFSIGFDRVEGDAVSLYVTESFTFRVLSGDAVVVLGG